ncbi:MAG: hypothetical protein P8J35_04285 [Candidatus Marinimicrobia bacterium]|nr:hypothetical protein [Candidatus Neomarinimicrobiota bacterium]
MKRYYLIRIAIFFTFFVTMAFGQNKKEIQIIKFLESRYSADIDSVRLFLDNNFIYYHSPYVGLGITTEMTNLGLLIKSVSPFMKTTNMLKKGDVILEADNYKLNNNKGKDYFKRRTNGAAGDSLKIIFSRNGDSMSTLVFLTKQQLQQRSDKFIDDIKSYGDRWFDYELSIIDIFSKKDRFVVHYSWEGSLIQEGPNYSFRAIEIIKTSRKTNKIVSIEATWTEKQFIDQFN